MAKAEYSEKMTLNLSCIIDTDVQGINCEFEEIDPITLKEALREFNGKKVTISVVSEDAR